MEIIWNAVRPFLARGIALVSGALVPALTGIGVTPEQAAEVGTSWEGTLTLTGMAIVMAVYSFGHRLLSRYLNPDDKAS